MDLRASETHRRMCRCSYQRPACCFGVTTCGNPSGTVGSRRRDPVGPVGFAADDPPRSDPVAWRGTWRAPNGRRYRVEACEGHRPPLDGDSNPPPSLGRVVRRAPRCRYTRPACHSAEPGKMFKLLARYWPPPKTRGRPRRPVNAPGTGRRPPFHILGSGTPCQDRCHCLESSARVTWANAPECRRLRVSGVSRSPLRYGRFCSVLVCTTGGGSGMADELGVAERGVLTAPARRRGTWLPAAPS